MENIPDVEFKITLKGLVNLNGLSIQDLESHLRQEMVNAIGNGLITGHTEAEVDEYQLDINVSNFGPRANKGDDLLSRSEFIEAYSPLTNDDGGFYCEEDLAAADTMAEEYDLGDDHIWTVVKENGYLYAKAGLHVEGKTCYIVTETRWRTGDEEAIWLEPPAL